MYVYKNKVKYKCKNCGNPCNGMFCKLDNCEKARWREYAKRNRTKRKLYEFKRYHKIRKNKILSKKYTKELLLRQNKFKFGVKDVSIIYKKFNFQCISCGKKAELIHHLDGNGYNKKNKNNDINNLVTLCRPCHIKHHLFNLTIL
jgi:5-methylcytosine-specific restriction endonuclease McrA